MRILQPDQSMRDSPGHFGQFNYDNTNDSRFDANAHSGLGHSQIQLHYMQEAVHLSRGMFV